MLPDGLHYVDSWIVDDDRLDRCFQLMETDDAIPVRGVARQLARPRQFEIYPVIDSAEAARRVDVSWPSPP